MEDRPPFRGTLLDPERPSAYRLRRSRLDAPTDEETLADDTVADHSLDDEFGPELAAELIDELKGMYFFG
jgi:hypothetical protein